MEILRAIISFFLRIFRKIFRKKINLDVDHDGKEDITIHLDE